MLDNACSGNGTTNVTFRCMSSNICIYTITYYLHFKFILEIQTILQPSN